MLLICVVFTLIKLPFLDLPYFWDEAWVYAPAVLDMLQNGPSLSPDSINPLLSRGHPILFHFLATCWMTVFGSSFVSAHSFSVFMALMLIISVYKLGESLHSKAIGFWAAFLLGVQPIFIQQAGFLLPEITLAVFVALTIKAFLEKKKWMFLLAGTCMLLTKETGILVIGMLGLIDLVDLVRSRNFQVKRLAQTIWIGSPVVLAFGYFLVQYLQFGWFMFPEHVSMFDTDPETWSKKFNLVFSSLILEQERGMLISLVFGAAALGWRKAPGLLRALFLFCFLTFMTMNGLSSWLPEWYFNYAFPIILFSAIAWTGAFFVKKGTKNHLFIPFTGLIILAMLAFTSAHFVIGRYLLFLIPLFLLSLILILKQSFRSSNWMFNLIMISASLIFYHLANRADREMNWLDNMRYVDQIHVLQNGIKYLEENTEYESDCLAGSFLIQQALMFPVQGYVVEDNKPECVKNHVAPNVEYVMMLNYEIDPGLEWVKTDGNFKQVFVETLGGQTVWVYKRIGG